MNRNSAPGTQFVNIDSLPLVISKTMDNGTPLYLIPVIGTDIVRIDFMFNGGAWVQDLPLQALLTMRLIKEGTVSRSTKKINELLDFYGATFSSVVYKTYSLITVVCLKKHMEYVIDIVQDILLNPVFDSNSFQIALQQLYANYMIKTERVKPQAERIFYETIFGKRHPMASFEYPEHFNILSVHLLKQYYHKCVNAANCKIFLTGGYDDSSVNLVQNTFGVDDWGQQSSWFELKPVEFVANPIEHYTLEKCDDNLSVDIEHSRVNYLMSQPTVQSAVFAGCILPKLNGLDRAYMILANMLLGGFFGSRLMNNIREKKGYTYGINSALIANPFFTLFCIQTETANRFVDSVIQETYHEILNIITETPSNEELEIVKKYYSGNISRIYEANFSFTNQLIKKIGVGNESVNTLDALNVIKNASPQNVMDTMKRYLSPNDVVWCVAGA